jgi:hypothetical protein
VNFPFISRIILATLEYEVYMYIAQLIYIQELLVPIRMSLIRVATSKENTAPRYYIVVKLKSSRRLFYCQHHGLIKTSVKIPKEGDQKP